MNKTMIERCRDLQKSLRATERLTMVARSGKMVEVCYENKSIDDKRYFTSKKALIIYLVKNGYRTLTDARRVGLIDEEFNVIKISNVRDFRHYTDEDIQQLYNDGKYDELWTSLTACRMSMAKKSRIALMGIISNIPLWEDWLDFTESYLGYRFSMAVQRYPVYCAEWTVDEKRPSETAPRSFAGYFWTIQRSIIPMYFREIGVSRSTYVHMASMHIGDMDANNYSSLAFTPVNEALTDWKKSLEKDEQKIYNALMSLGVVEKQKPIDSIWKELFKDEYTQKDFRAHYRNLKESYMSFAV